MRSCINVSQKNNLFLIKINEDSEFENIEKSIKHKVMQLKKIYKDSKIPIKITGKVLKNKEIANIVYYIIDNYNIKNHNFHK